MKYMLTLGRRINMQLAWWHNLNIRSFRKKKKWNKWDTDKCHWNCRMCHSDVN